MIAIEEVGQGNKTINNNSIMIYATIKIIVHILKKINEE